jgi:hypothetical protein
MKKLFLSLALLLFFTASAWAGPTYQGAGFVSYETGTVVYSAGNFTALGSMIWTVDAGDVTTYAYNIVYKTMTVYISLNNTSISGTPAASLIIKIPNGKLSANTLSMPIFLYNNSIYQTGIADIVTGSNNISIYNAGLTNWTASTNTTIVRGSLTFEIQ